MAAIEQNESFSGRGGELTLALVDKIAASALASSSTPAMAASARSPSFLTPRRSTCCSNWP